nr:uncharacterized protein LOC113403760 [Vanessa tameamea]
MDIYTVRGAIAILFYISRLFGVAPLKFEYMDGGLKATVSSCVAIYCYVLTFVVHASGIYCLCMANFVQEAQVLQDLALFPLLNYFVTICTLLASGTASYGGIRRFKRTFAYFIILKKICYNINDNDTNPNHKLTAMMLMFLKNL